MLQYRCFLLYSYKSSQIILSLRRDIQGDSEWFSELIIMIEKLKQADVIEEKWFQFDCCHGKVRGKYDIFNQRFLILISKHSVDDIKTTQLLHEIFAYLIEKPLYNQELIQDLEIDCKYDIEQIIQLKEYQQIHNNKGEQTLEKFSSLIYFYQRQQQEGPLQRPIFKGFMIYDLKKEYFFMLIKRGFENNNFWQQQRLKIQSILNRKLHSKQLKPFSFTGELGEFLFEYHPLAKCFLILLTDPQFPYYPQRQLLQKITKFITITEPAFQRKSKFELENNLLQKIRDLLDFEELNYFQQPNQQCSDQFCFTHQDYIKIRSLTEIPDGFQQQNRIGSRSEKQFPYLMSDDKISQSFIF